MSAAGPKEPEPRTPPLPPLLFLGCLLAGGALEKWWPFPFTPPSLPMLAPLLLLVAAAALFLWAIVTIQQHHTPIHPRATPRTLITSGPFRFTRNPIYLGLLLALTATGFIFDTLWLVLAVPLLATLLRLLVIPGEENALTAVFGDEYQTYRRRVRRWL